MLARIPPSQRRLVILVGLAAVAAGAFAGVAIVLASGDSAVRPSEYQPFEVGNAARLGEAVATEQPVFFADPTGGTRGFALALEDDELVALHVIPPGGSADCPIDWKPEDRRFEDCRDRVWDTHQLRRFRSSVNETGLFVVDLRTMEAPPTS